MISLENVVQVFHLTVLHRLRADSLRLQLGDRLGQGGSLSVLITRGDPAVVVDRRVLARKRLAAATFRFGER